MWSRHFSAGGHDLQPLLNGEYPAHGLGRWWNAEQRSDRWRDVDGVDDGQAHTCSNTGARGEEDAVQLATEGRRPVLEDRKSVV